MKKIVLIIIVIKKTIVETIIIIIVVVINTNDNYNGGNNKNNKNMNNDTYKMIGMFIFYIMINLIIVSGVNIAYIYVALYQSNDILILVQISLSIFKLTWNNIISPKMIRLINIYFINF